MRFPIVVSILLSFVFSQSCSSSKLLPPCQQITMKNDQELFSADDATAQFGGNWTSSGVSIDPEDKDHCSFFLDGTSNSNTYQIIFQNTPASAEKKEEVSASVYTEPTHPSYLSFSFPQRSILVTCWKKPAGCSREELDKISQVVLKKLY